MKININDEDSAWLDYRARFSSVYDNSNYSSPLQSLVMRASHRLTERPFGSTTHFSKTIEVGAGTGEHLGYVQHSFDKYILTDLDEETLRIARKKNQGIHEGKIHYETQTASGLNYPDNSFDRLIATHVLEHIYQPHLALKEWARVVNNGGLLSILIPTDPGIAWRLGRTLGPRKNAIAQGIAYDYVMAREHVNSCNNLIAIMRHYFKDSKESWWPLPVQSIDVNLFFAFHAVVHK